VMNRQINKPTGTKAAARRPESLPQNMAAQRSAKTPWLKRTNHGAVALGTLRPAMAQERRILAGDELRRLSRGVFGFVLVG
jgi:hypothetical protein